MPLWHGQLGAWVVATYPECRRALKGAHELFRAAYRVLPGLARTVRGPVMSTTPGKLVVDGVLSELLHLRFLQARDQSLTGRPFLARYRDDAAWIDELELLPDTPPDIQRALAATAETL